MRIQGKKLPETIWIVDLSRYIQERSRSLDAVGLSNYDGQSSLKFMRWRIFDGINLSRYLDRILVNSRVLNLFVQWRRVVRGLERGCEK
jgi:hypothetical protein